MPRDIPSVKLVAELHRRQAEMYAGGEVGSVVELLADDIVWHVPGESPIAGDHRGVEQVVAYFERRRRIANTSLQMRPGELISTGDAVAQFVEGSASLNGQQIRWKTVGIYRVDPAHSRVLEAWLIPLDGDLFDRIWSPGQAVSDPR